MPLPPQLVTHSQSAFEHLLEHQSEAINAWPEPVSYTHLTLPTMELV